MEEKKKESTGAEQRPPEPTIVSRLIHLSTIAPLLTFYAGSNSALNTRENIH